MHRLKALTDRIERVHSENIELHEPFLDIAAKFADMKGTCVLMSGGNLDCAEYHIIAAQPWLSLTGRGHELLFTHNAQTHKLNASPFDVLDELLRQYHMPFSDSLLPISAGLFGYLAYDLKDQIETLPRTAVDDLGLPQICLFAPSILIVQEVNSGITRLCIPERWDREGSCLEEARIFVKKRIERPTPEKKEQALHTGRLRSNFTRTEYEDAIKKIREYIAAGDVYQVNMSQRFEMAYDGGAFGLFGKLYLKNPAPFFAYVNAGDHHIISTSPERFIKQTGVFLETRPIKGTRPRGRNASQDAALKKELTESAKDDAELSMIVDLMRNDLGKVCRGGSVKVARHKRLEAYQNVYHLISIVEGELKNELGAVDVLKATFPGGSITGCPKIRSMEIIDELESCRRHIYTGSIGYISFHDTMDLSIAIRTATAVGGRLYFSVGGGIVFDSEPGDEYEETLHKGQTLMEIFSGKGAIKQTKMPVVWFNGKYTVQEKAKIAVADLGFQYGQGVFETIRVNDLSPCLLAGHVERLNRGWRYLFPDPPPDVTWEFIIKEVVMRNDLAKGVAAVKIILAGGQNPEAKKTMLVTARPYTPRTFAPGRQGLVLKSYPESRQTPLANYKTLNYLYYYTAGQWAQGQGGDEALILNPDGSISETHTANILVLNGNSVFKPLSRSVLPGIMESVVCECLARWGREIHQKKLFPEDLATAEGVIITNSLIGALPVQFMDGREIGVDWGLVEKLNQVCLGGRV